MIEVVRGVRFSQPGKSVRAVYETAIEKAQALGEVAPSRWQVRRICAEISKPERLLADGRDDLFRNSYEATRSLEAQRQKSRLIVYQIDPTRVNVLVKDLRKPSCRSKSGMVRPWLTVCFDSRSRLVLAAIFTYDHPNRYTIAAVIRDAVLAPKTRPYGGVPHEIWIDRGKELLSHHVEQLTQELQIQLHKCHRHRPQEKGLIERFFRTLNTRFWSTQPGYVGSNVVERNPHVKAVLTIQELEQRFWVFIEKYHQEVHSQTHEAPIEYWKKHCYAEPADLRQLDVLLQEPVPHYVQRTGIHMENRVYWNKALATRIGTWVVIRSAPHYQAPDQIEVFQKKQWLCTAKATDTLEGQAVTQEDVVAAKHDQKAFLRGDIQHAREAVRAVDRAIAAHLQQSEQETPQPSQGQLPAALAHQPVASPSRPPDFLDEMARQTSVSNPGELS
jgi:transposase InsO family protein